ncbi:acyl-CoA dehydrogenase [Pseudomonas sp. C9-3]|uniref:acyl-CoA dehydrogenase n=1 Tax=Pseudomonas sp. C9-3 TaxID=3078264 RepID=UPI0028E9AE43|nr:acyl-CoA dehydrogenase [Pseudomonas sp. C9-3]
MSVVPFRLAATRPVAPPVPSTAGTWARALRESGLLRLSLPAQLGGSASPWQDILQTLRDLCERDGGLARLFAVHHLQLARVSLLGSREQVQRLLNLTLLREPLWGALGDGQSLQAAEHVRGGFRVNGAEWDAFTVEAADWLVLRAWYEPGRDFLLAALPGARAGLVLRGGAQCNELRLHPEDILLPPGLAITPRRSLCDGLALLLEANVALGLALHAAERLELAQSSDLLRLLGLGLVLSEQAAAQLDDDIAAGAGLSFSRSSHFSNLAIQALAVAREAAQSSLRAEGLRARLLGAAH